MNFRLLCRILCIFYVIKLHNCCRIDSPLHGVYKKQSYLLHSGDNTLKDAVVYEDITISSTSISEYGDCYEKTGDAYILGLKRMGRSVCFRCITPIVLDTNVVQLAHQQEDICFETQQEARMSCFDSQLVTLNDGVLVFKVNGADASCGIDGRLSIGYKLRDSSLHCEIESGSTLLTSSGEDSFVHLSNDSSCAQLNPNNSFEIYTFRSRSMERPFSPCQFPDWLRGSYNSLSVSSNYLQYTQQGTAGVPVISHCVHVNNDRILVYSETKCGEPMGYHCLWFNARSESLIEFKTSTPLEVANYTLCSDESEFQNVSWTTAVIKKYSTQPCGIVGKYSTPKDLRIEDCYNVTVDCNRNHIMRISAYHCITGTVFDNRIYNCLASWKDEQTLFMYTKKGNEDNCFVSQFQSGRFFLSSTGSYCSRQFNFSANKDKTLVLEETAPCRAKSKSSRRPIQSVRPVVNAVVNVQPPTETPPHLQSTRGDTEAPLTLHPIHTDTEATPPLNKPMIENNGEKWLWDGNSSGSAGILSIFVIYAIILVFYYVY